MDTTGSFVFYSSWVVDCEEMDNEERLEYYDAIIRYGLTGNIGKIKSRYVKGCLRMVTRDIDDNLQRREATATARAEAGKRSGESRRNKKTNVSFVEQNEQNQTKRTKPNKTNVNVNVNVDGNVNVDVDKEIISILLTHADAEHNTEGLVKTLKDFGLSVRDIQQVCENCDYGIQGHKIWKLLASREFRAKVKEQQINGNYIIKCINGTNK